MINAAFNEFYNKNITISQRHLINIIIFFFLDILFFVCRASILRSSLYTNFHFVIASLIIFFTIAFMLDKDSLDKFLMIFVSSITSGYTLPTWLNESLTISTNKHLSARYFVVSCLLVLDIFFISFKMLVVGITLYTKIHFLIAFALLISCISAIWIFYYQITINSSISKYKPSKALNTIKANPVLVEQHPFHILPTSILPFLTAVFVFDFLFFNVNYMHYGWTNYIGLHFFISIPGLLLVLAYWFFSIHNEANEGYHTKKVRWNLLHGVMLFITSEVMLFFSIFWAFFHSSMSPTVAIYCTWPPVGIEIIDPWALPLLNTVILLSSGVSLTYAHRELANANYTGVSTGLLVTIWYGLLFTGIQLFEYINSPFSINDGIYGSVFFLATGFHGLHVIIGSIMLLVTLLRNAVRQITSTQHVGFIASAWYWHFVDVVWLFLFVSIYWWGS